MNAAANENNGESRQRVLLAEIASLKEQRGELIKKLADCHREVKHLRAQLEGRDK